MRYVFALEVQDCPTKGDKVGALLRPRPMLGLAVVLRRGRLQKDTHKKFVRGTQTLKISRPLHIKMRMPGPWPLDKIS